MTVTVDERFVDVGHRVDGTAWRIRVVVISGSEGGPKSAIVGGIWGDKPLGCLAVLELEAHLVDCEPDLTGTIVLVPAANGPALEAGTRVSPDHQFLNRRFPGAPSGLLTDQIAHHLLNDALGDVDAVLDLHSGTPTMGIRFIYDFGDQEFASSFGYLPVALGMAKPGQLCSSIVERGGKALLAEFGGGGDASTKVGVQGSLNYLRFRGHIAGGMTGPTHVPLVPDIDLYLASTSGIWTSSFTHSDLGRVIPAGTFGHVVNPSSGAVQQKVEVGREGGILLMAVSTPTMVNPGGYISILGYPSGEIQVPSP